jgi:hypothetical protein
MRCTITVFFEFFFSNRAIYYFIFFHFRMSTERISRVLRFLKGKGHNWLNLKIFINKNKFCGSVTTTQLKVYMNKLFCTSLTSLV